MAPLPGRTASWPTALFSLVNRATLSLGIQPQWLSRNARYRPIGLINHAAL